MLLRSLALLALAWLPIACGDTDDDESKPWQTTDVATETPATIPPASSGEGGLVVTTMVIEDDEKADSIRGTVELDEAYASYNGTRTLFIIVKARAEDRMPRATLKVDKPTFPFAFEIGPEHVMLNVDNAEEMLQGDFKIYARLDADGSALANKGDLESDIIDVTVGTSGHVLTINKSL